MIRQIHNLVQGSPEWHAFRAKHFTASEAAAMMGVSPYTTRDQLLRQKKTGITPEVNDATQRVFDNGHRVEALARPIIEAEIGQDLYPAIYSYDFLSASCDGITMDESIAWEHKQFNAALFASVQAGILPEHHKPQCQQVLFVTGAEKLIFTVSDGTAENMASMTVYPDEACQQRLIAGWNQFAADLEAYAVEEVKPESAKAAVESLPAVFVQVQGSLTCQDNIGKFAEQMAEFIKRVPASPKTDDDFALCEAAVKTLTNAEDALKAAKQNSLAYVQSLADLHQLIDNQAEIARSNRLRLDKLVKAEKENRRTAIVNNAQIAFRSFVAGMKYTDHLLAIKPDFAGAIKGLKTISSIENAVNTTLANAKIEATQAHDKVSANMETIVSAGDYAFLFRDLRDLVLKDADYVALTVKTRIADHQAAEEVRLDAERERIRAEEQARIEREAQEKQKVEQAAPEPASVQAEPAKAATVAQPVLRTVESVAANDSGERITLGQINTRLAPIQLSADGLRSLGFEPVATERAAKLYRSGDLPAICDALIKHIQAVNLRKAA